MIELRVTKYDPANRNSTGAYTRDDWISVSDIGHVFDGIVLTESEYQRVEDAYATAAVDFLREAEVHSLTVVGLEKHAIITLPFAEGSSLGLSDIGDVVRRVLREDFWCRLEGSEAFIHFGWDYFMYVGVPRPCPNATSLARKLGLFVEPFLSPYSVQRHATRNSTG